MKRHFLTGLKAFAVSALALAAVSCYDDSELWGELEGLEQRVAALEEKLNSEVATLNSKIGAVETAYKAADADLLKKLNDLDAKLVAELAKLAADLDAADGSLDGLVTTDDLAAEIKKLTDAANAKYAELAGVDKEILAALTKVAVTKVEKNAAGNAVLTFLDGTTLEVGAADANANNTGLVTVVDGKWAIVGADGKTTVLDALVHPDTELEFKVDPKSYEVFVSYDGEEWIATGVIVKDAQTINLVTGFVDAKDHVVITVGGVEYKLPKVSTNSFDIKSGKVFFQSEQKKVVTLKKEGIVSMMLAKKPAGWTVELLDETLEITAPYIEENGGFDGGIGWSVSAEEEIVTDGVIEVWVVTEDGKTLVGKLLVEVGEAPANVTIDSDYETVSVSYGNDYHYSMFYGACAEENFDAKEILNQLPTAYYEPVDGIYYGLDHAQWNNSVRLFETEHDFAEMLGAEPEVGKTYVVWSIAADMVDPDWINTMTATCNSTEVDFIKQYVTVVGVEIAKPVTSWRDAELNVSVEGTDKFYIGVYPGTEDMLTNPDGGALSSEGVEYIESLNQCSLAEALERGVEGIQGAVHQGAYTGSVKWISDYMWLEFTPGDEYTLIVLPIIEGKVSYSASDLHFKEFKIEELLYGGSATVTLGEGDPKSATNITFSSFNLPIETDGERVYYSIWNKAEYDEFVTDFENDDDDDTDMLTFLMDNLDFSEYVDYSSTIYEITESPALGTTISMETEYVVAAFAVDANGQCSELVTLDVTTLGLPYTTDEDNYNVTVTSVSAVDGSATATFNIEGEGAKILYYKKGVNHPEYPNLMEESAYDDFVVSALSYNEETVSLNSSNFVDGVLTVSDIYMGNNYDTYIYAFVEYEDGTISKVTVSDKFNNIETPNKKQWVFSSSETMCNLAMIPYNEEITFCFDLGLALEDVEVYPMMGEPVKGASVIVVDYGTIPEYAAQGAPLGTWQPAFQGMGLAEVTPTSQTTGNISWCGMNIPYNEFDGDSCVFDFSEIMEMMDIEGEHQISCTLAEEFISILIQ